MIAITIYLGIGLMWGLGFEFLIWTTLREKSTLTVFEQMLQICLWPAFLCIFIWGMFIRSDDEK